MFDWANLVISNLNIEIIVGIFSFQYISKVHLFLALLAMLTAYICFIQSNGSMLTTMVLFHIWNNSAQLA